MSKLTKRTFTTKDKDGLEFSCTLLKTVWYTDRGQKVDERSYTGMGMEAPTLKKLKEMVSAL